MSGNTKSKFEQEIPGWSDFVGKCEAQVKADKDKFGNKIVYFPSAEICSEPDFCLIAMEPPLDEKKKSISQIEKEVKDGHKIFFPPIVSYCAWRYLCNKEYKFHITDLDKGAKQNKLSMHQKAKTWLPLLIEEIELLKKPTTIILSDSKELHKKMSKNGFNCDYSVLHYSTNNNGRVTAYEADKIVFADLPTKEEVKDYTRKIKNEFGAKFAPSYYTPKRIEEELEEEKQFTFSDDLWKKWIVYYKDKFTRIRNGKI